MGLEKSGYGDDAPVMLPQHPPRPLLEKGFCPCVLEQILPVVTLRLFGLRRPRNQPPLHDLKFLRARNDDAVRLGIGGNHVDILAQPNVIHADLVFRISFLLRPLLLFLLGENLTRGFDNIQLLAVSFGDSCGICR